MNKEFVTYNQALTLKELGFDEPCFGRWIEPTELSISAPADDEYCQKQHEFSWVALAPLYQQAFRWFREKHGLNSYIYQRSNITYRGVIHKNMKIAVNYTSDSSNYEEAEQACLDKLIEIVKHEDTTR